MRAIIRAGAARGNRNRFAELREGRYGGRRVTRAPARAPRPRPPRHVRRLITTIVLLAAAGALAWALWARFQELGDAVKPVGERAPVPVETAAVERGPLVLRRTFSGGLESAAEFSVAPKISGRIARLEVELGDVVTRGALVALLDDAELVQALRQAEAEIAVARAGMSGAKSALEVATRELARVEALSAEGLSTAALFDTARSEVLTAQAQLQLEEATVVRAESQLESARIRHGYARVTADWSGGDETRVVAARLVDDGGTVAANTPIVTIVELDPILAVVDVPERDYARLALGQRASITSDAHTGTAFEGAIVRIAPVFRRSTRQARVEIEVPNAGERLRPGMFVRATLELARFDDALTVPFDALTQRNGATGVFVLDAARERVAWRAVEVGVREGERVQLLGEAFSGEVVVLGQDGCDDGTRVAPVATTSTATESAP